MLAVADYAHWGRRCAIPGEAGEAKEQRVPRAAAASTRTNSALTVSRGASPVNQLAGGR